MAILSTSDFVLLFSYTSEPTGHLIIRVWDHDRWSSDDFLGEVAIPLKGLKNGKPVDEWYQLTNEPKKTKDKNPNRGVGEIRVKVHFPLIGGPIEENADKKPAGTDLKDSKAPSPAATPKSASVRQTDVKLLDKYNVGKELGRCVLKRSFLFLFMIFKLPFCLPLVLL